MRTPLGLRLLHALARGSRWLYPRRIRESYGDDFADVADHWYAQTRMRRGPFLATLAAAQVLAADAFAAVPATWKEALLPAGDGARRMRDRLRAPFNGSGRDLKLTLRTAARRPALTLLLIGMLGTGIGTSTAAFDALDRTILNPLPYERDGKLVLLVMQEPALEGLYGVRLEQFHAWRAEATTLTRIEVFRRTSATRQRPEGADVLEAMSISSGLPGMLGLVPIAGRMFDAGDAQPSAAPTVMLTERFWRREFGGDPAVVGRSLPLITGPAQIIGIWPDGARLDFQPIPDVLRVMPAGKEFNSGAWVQVLARIAPGRSRREVETELAARLLPPPPGDARPYRPLTMRSADVLLGRPFITGIWMVFGGSLLLLAGALSNTVHLLLERSLNRQHELAVRRALGASRLRLARLFLVDGLFYGAAGLTLGAGIAVVLERLIAAYEPRLFGTVTGAGLYGRAFSFAAAAGAAAVVACTLAPLVRSGRRDLVADVNRGHARTTATRPRIVEVLVSTQAALAVLLVSGAALLGHSLQRLLAVDPGMAVNELAEVSVALPATRYPTPASRELYATRAYEALRSLPTVTGVVTSGMPILNTSLMGGMPRLDGEAEPAGADRVNTAVNGVRPEYFAVTGMRMIEGRPFTADEPRAVVVSEKFAARRPTSVVGRTLYLPRRPEGYQIVGVVKDAALMGLAERDADRAAVYTLATSRADSSMRFLIRTSGDPNAVLAAARSQLAAIDPAIPARGTQTGLDVVRRQTAQHRLVAILLAGLAAVGFILAMSGIYGSVALSVVRRTREVGVRMALGASPERLIRQFIASGLRPVMLGAAVGGLAAFVAAPYVNALLFDLNPRNPATSLAAMTVVVLTGCLAALVPSRRISRLDPAATLRD